jgi:hypothetical protein
MTSSSESAESLRSLWASIFRRKGREGVYTRPFDDLTSQQQKMLTAELKLRSSELPVIASITDENNWCVLTTERLVSSSGNERRDIPLHSVVDVSADLESLRSTGQSKLALETLQIRTEDDEHVIIRFEAGAPLSGIWNVLRNVAARNRGPRQS